MMEVFSVHMLMNFWYQLNIISDLDKLDPLSVLLLVEADSQIDCLVSSPVANRLLFVVNCRILHFPLRDLQQAINNFQIVWSVKIYKRNIHTNLSYSHFFKHFCSTFNWIFTVAMMTNYYSCKTFMPSTRVIVFNPEYLSTI